MFEKEIIEALRLEDYDVFNLKIAYEREKLICDGEKNINIPKSHKNIDLWKIVSLSRNRIELDRVSHEYTYQLAHTASRDVERFHEVEEDLEVLRSNALFSERFSKAYHIRYLKTILNYIRLSTRDYSQNTFLILLANWKQTLRESISNIWDIVCFNSDEEKTHYPEFVRERVREEIQEFIKHKDYIIDDVESYNVIIELTALAMRIEDGNIGDCHYTARLVTYTNIAFELYIDDRASEGLPFAKEGLLVNGARNKAAAYNVLGLCSIDTYGKLQLAYDVYFSWINHKIVGEMTEVYSNDDLEKLLPDENDLEAWLLNKESNEELTNIFMNFAYVCNTISETYNKNDDRRKDFLNLALSAIEKAIFYSKDNDYFQAYSTVVSKIGMLAENSLEQRREYFSSAIEYVVRHLRRNKRKNFSYKVVRIQSNYADLLLDWLLITYQIKTEETKTTTSQVKTKKRQMLTFRKFLMDRDVSGKANEFMGILSSLDSERVNKNSLEHSTIEQNDPFISDRLSPFFDLSNYFGQVSDLGKNSEMARIDQEIDYGKQLQLLLMLLKSAANALKSQLKRQDYYTVNYFIRYPEKDKDIKKLREQAPSIAYYTTLSNVKFLFDEISEAQALGSSEEIINTYKNTSTLAQNCDKTESTNKTNKKNCLTLMHVRHMNDPLEGLMLIRILFEEINNYCDENALFTGHTPETYRDEIYDRNYVFLKAFTERLDKLDMWNRYASDRTSGKDSDGCCVEINPETFLRQDKDSERTMRLLYNTKDDFNLYRVLYLDKKGDLLEEKDTNVALYFSTFVRLIITLNEYVASRAFKRAFIKEWEDIVDRTYKITNDILRNIIFLFKPEAYSEEEESRIIFVKTSEQRSSFRSVDNPIPRVYITPFRQVYVDRITLGPKAENPDHWLPYLQYKIDGMRQIIKEDLDEGTRISYFPEKISVRKSTIPYQD